MNNKENNIFFSTVLLFCLFLSFSFKLKAQLPNIQWALEVDGQSSVYIVDLVVDSAGNSYAAFNYTSKLSIPELKTRPATFMD
jgi:hypothetical protein